MAKVITGVNQRALSGGVDFRAVTARFFQVSNGGFDTHADQGGADPNGQHFALLGEVSDSIEAFYNDMADLGIANKVLILTYSEFSRRIEQNENGTDHGSQAPMFIVGGSVVRRRLRQPPEPRRRRRRGQHQVLAGHPERLPLDGFPRRVRHDHEALAEHAGQHDRGSDHAGERDAEARYRGSDAVLDRGRSRHGVLAVAVAATL